MAIERWDPPVKLSRAEEAVLRVVAKRRKLFGFLRLHRHEIITKEFEQKLAAMYRDTGAGSPPNAPGLMCLALLLQAYSNASDAEAVDLSRVDARWQLVLGNLGTTEPAFSQGSLQAFRERLIAHDLDRLLLERTVELARQAKEFDWKKLPKDLRVGIDSRPLLGAGRVEDTFNLIGHAARKIAECAAEMSGLGFDVVCRRAGIPLLLASSIKAGLDIDWSNQEEKTRALATLTAQLQSLIEWFARLTAGEAVEGPITRYLESANRILKQDLEEDEGGDVRIREGVASDRQVSVEDPEMRHGRKTRSKRFNGYKEHIAADLDTGIVLAGTITPANVPEAEAAPSLKVDIERQGLRIAELSIDRGYLNSPIVDEVEAAGGTVLSKPWPIGNNKTDLFSKSDFKLNMRDRTITCPAGEIRRFEFDEIVRFDAETCNACELKKQCTRSPNGRQVRIADDEQRQHRLRKLQSTKKGRQALRLRVGIEHKLGHLASKQGPRARYRGVRKNTYDVRRFSALQNLETIQRVIEAKAAA
jgi:hypothetical protein